MFASGKRKQQKYVRQLQCQEQCIDHIPYYLSGLPSAHFSDNLSRNSCILCQDHGQSFLTISTSRTFITTKKGNIHQLRLYDYSFSVNSMKEQCQLAFRL